MPFITTSVGGDGAGTTGPQGPAGEGFNFRGAWVTDTFYLQNDVVTQNGSTYIANYDYQDTSGPFLDGDLWAPLALKGEPGTGGEGGDIADFIFTSNEGQSVISLPGDKGMKIEAGVDSDLYLTAGDDLYIQTLGTGDDIHINAADDIRFSAGNENETTHFWRMDSEGQFQLPGDGYISNPSSVTYTQNNRLDTYSNNYLNDSTGLNNTSAVLLPVDETTMWYVMNQGSFTSPVTITFQDSTTVTTVAIYDATSQGTPAVIFQWNTGDLVKTFEETFPLNISVAYQTTSYGQHTIVLDPASYGNNQYVVIDPTAPNHIHIRAGGQIDQSSADLILGGEENHVRISDGEDSVNILASNVNINSYTSPSSLNINTYSGAIVNSNRTSTYASEDKVVATLGDINNIVSDSMVRYSPTFTATGLEFTGSGETYPTYNSYYVKSGTMVSFVIEVDLSTVTNFGTGQYKLQLPFTPAFGFNHFSGWAWADPNVSPDIGTGHTIINADTSGITSVLDLHYLKSAGGANAPIREGLFMQGTPVTLTTISKIYVNGTYIMQGLP